jgi:pimeloyl-ACP methyl ester carboxylesterase
MIGHELQGAGPHGVVVLNDWMCDTSTWDDARAYLDDAQLAWAFADLRGYGRSRHLDGAFTLEEAAGDVLALADELAWRTFRVVGHSMSSLVALHLAQHSERVERAVAVTPPPLSGLGYDDATLDAVRAVAAGDDERRERALRARLLGERLSDGWLRFKLRHWRERSNPTAAAAYVTMFGRRGLPDRSARIASPVLVVTGEMDVEVMRCAAVTAALSPLCENLSVASFAECGHYPMQEAPPRFAAVVERFLTG